LFRFSTSFIAGLQTFLRNVVSSTSRHSEIWTHNFSGDRHWLHTTSSKKIKNRMARNQDNVSWVLLAHGRWFSPASSTTKTGRHDIVEILLKVALNTKNLKAGREPTPYWWWTYISC
jgi:hypothetical protein